MVDVEKVGTIEFLLDIIGKLRLHSATPNLLKLHTKLDKLFDKKQELTERLREELGRYMLSFSDSYPI